jgi:glycosyltransferase involved in cell wall biosynthesis
MQKSWNRWLEQLFFKRADVVIANTDAMAEKWKNAYPDSSDRIHLIWNGFDPEDPIDPRPAPKRDFKLISHVGELYRGRNVSALLESISRLIYTKRLEPNHVRVQLVGSIENDCLPAADFLKQAKKEGWLEIVPERVPQEEARRIAQTSDALLLVQPQSRIQVPGKLFDYLRLRRPILAYVLPNTPIERILKQTGVTYSCVYAGSPPQQIDDALENFFHLQGDAMPANSWFEDNFDARKQTQTLDTLIRSMHER